jgi:hypothetical protein
MCVPSCLARSLLWVPTMMLVSYHHSRPLLIATFLMMAGVLFGAGRVHAEPSSGDKALATILFQEGRGLMSEGRIPEACQKLEESQRLDPSGGTLLNLALCHEQDGRLASSWSEFKEAITVARRDGRRDRENEAVNRVAALEPRLSRLTIVVPASAQVEGLLIERDGHEVGRGAWSTAIPVDGGTHVVRATALGRDPFTKTIIVGKESDSRTVDVPVLATPVVVVTSSSLATPPPMTAAAAARFRWVGITTAGAGVILLGAAGYALVTALGARDASNADCWPDGCGTAGLQQRRDAVSRGNLATWLGLGGVALLGAGATSFYLGHRARVPNPEGQAPARVVLGAAPGTLMAGIQGGF